MDNKLRVLYFIGHCLSLDEHPSFRETIIVQFSDPDYDWNTFIWTCSNHLVLPVIYLKFRKHNLLGYLPEVLAQHLEEIYLLNRTRNEQILLQMKEINATLNKEGISPIYLKGTGNLIDGIYSDIGERIIGDIDLLIPNADYLKAVELTKEIGYANHWGDPRNPEKLKHYPSLYKDDVPADIEIHRIPVQREYLKYINSEMILNEETAVSSFPGCFVPCDDHKILHSFVHSQLCNTGYRLGIISLRDIYDLYLFSKRTDLTTALCQVACQRIVEAYFAIAQNLLGITTLDQLSLASKVFIWKYRMNVTSPLFYQINRFPWVISEMLLHCYPRKIKEAIIYKDARQSLFRRLGTWKWYIHHLDVYKKMITG
ncbi:MAG TPA: nucleotidyltransferase family protein [Prolixibacteraceae bacterium]